MVRYILAAGALKAFSINETSRALYRRLGNILRKHKRMHRQNKLDSYIRRGNLFVNLCDKYKAVKAGDKLLEIGTGWMHWYSIYLRLFYEVGVTMLDVWDNRQFDATKTMLTELLAKTKDDPTHCKRIIELEKVLQVDTFEELYALLDLKYVIEETGSLCRFPNDSFDCVFSFHVLEHVQAENADELTKSIRRVLRPGGYSIHQIGLNDHLAHYDKKVSAKNYLRYSDTAWKRYFENTVQYFNRLQASDWLGLFSKHDFSLLEKKAGFCDIESLPIDAKYRDYERQDLECVNLTMVHRNPE